MALASGTRFGNYEIGDAIGAGGMGEVYRAHDTTLERDVAIKVLPASFAEDAGRVERFEREARTLASLNHPNIAHIYGLERSDGTTALVMELVEGPTLADRIAEGPLPADQALGIAMQIADALEAAHSQSIVHRDLKPANIKLRPDGTVKVLDFGIAKALESPLAAASGPGSPQLTTPAMTQAGIILGTAQYMSPEQARGKPVDQRADIWAFGCVLYEMLTGQPVFGGDDVTITLARVVDRDANLDTLPGTIAPSVRRTIELCLRKDVRKRLHSIGDVRLGLEGAFEADARRRAGDALPAAPAWRRAIPVAAALVVGGVLVGAGSWMLRPSPPPRPVNRFAYDLPVGTSLRNTQFRVLAFSRDGRSIVYNTDEGLFLRAFDDLEARVIPGTEESLGSPDVSPDGRWISYGVPPGVAKRISINGGAPITIGNSVGSGISWEPGGWLLTPSLNGISRIPADGGPTELIIPAEDGIDYYGPRLLPDGDTVLFSMTRSGSWDDAQVVAQSISTGERKLLISGGADARYIPTGHLVYAFQDGLFAIAFDPDTVTTSGPAVPVLQGVMRTSPARGANYGVSDDGTLVYMTGRADANGRRLVWVDRAGNVEPVAAPPREYTSPRLSPDGTKLAVNPRDQDRDIWIWDFARETFTRLSFDPGQERFPAWSPDGERVAYSAQSHTEGSNFDLVWQAADGTGSVERLAGASGQLFPTSFVPDGSGVLGYDDSEGNDDIVLVGLAGERITTPLLAGTFGERMPEISPDGRWLAYASDESGREEIYVRPFPDVDSGRWQVSRNGGTQPLWSRDGRELFYRDENAMMAVAVEASSSFSVRTPEILFEGQYFGGAQGGAQGGRAYDYDADGERFLMIQPLQDAASQTQIVIVENWFEELKRLVPTE